MSNTFNERVEKMKSFMEMVDEARVIKEQEDNFMNSTDYKLKTLDKCTDDAKNICLDKIFARIYKDAVPLNDDYKAAYNNDLDASFRDFMAQRCPKGMEFYVKEGLKKNSPFAKKVLEAVNNLVDEEMRDKAFNIEDIDPAKIPMDANGQVQVKLDIVGNELSVPEISQAIKDNVKTTALSEITRAKENKENLQKIENELAQDIKLTNEEAIKEALELRGYGEVRDYTPTLFEAVFINKMNKLTSVAESTGDFQGKYLYGALTEYGKDETITESGIPDFATLEEMAFIEAVKEYTGLSMLKALKLENFTKGYIQDLTDAYSSERF